MTLQKIDKALDVLGRGFDILTTIACILAVGCVAYFILGGMDYPGALRIILTGLIGIFGGLLVKLVLRAIVHLNAF